MLNYGIYMGSFHGVEILDNVASDVGNGVKVESGAGQAPGSAIILGNVLEHRASDLGQTSGVRVVVGVFAPVTGTGLATVADPSSPGSGARCAMPRRLRIGPPPGRSIHPRSTDYS